MTLTDKWEIATAMPGDWTEVGEWMFSKGGGEVYHQHYSEHLNGMHPASRFTLYMIYDGVCRSCGATVPPGVLFLAKTSNLNDLGDV